MLALIDADIAAYRAAWASENDDVGIAKLRLDEMLDGILIDTGATEFTCWLSDSGENNFRYKIYPQYKANRATLPKPKHLDLLKEHLIKAWNARIAFGMEADDALGIEQSKWFGFLKSGDAGSTLTVICTIDKDLQQIPGNHFNFVKKEHSFVTPEEGLKYFYKQILIGDTSDNIVGCRGIGTVKAGKLIDGVGANPENLARIVLDTYIKKGGLTEAEAILHITQVGQVLKIKQEQEEPLWVFPLQNQIKALPASFTPATLAVTTPSTGPIMTEVVVGSQLLGEPVERCSNSKTPL